MKGKNKTQKGITLIALIITIVVLLILAAVAITAVSEFNIIGNANSAAEKYQNKADKEDVILKNYDQTVGGYIGNNGSDDEKIEEITFSIDGVTYKVPKRLELGLVVTIGHG